MSIREANRLLREAQLAAPDEEAPLYPSDETTVAAAQVEATIALVRATRALAEQQRLGNIIALAGLEMNGPMRNLASQPLGEYSVEPTDELKEGLGL